MAKINFPDPADFPNGWSDPNGQIWDHDTMGWLARNPTSGGGALPPGGNDKDVLTKSGTADGIAVWANFDAGIML